MVLPACILAVSLAMNLASAAESDEVIFRNAPEDGLPVCVESRGQTFLLRWIAEENYRREVWMRVQAGEVCRDYPTTGWLASEAAFRVSGFRKWKSSESPFRAETNREVAWIERGANRRPPTENGGEYGTRNPGFRYTPEANRVLSSAYGKQWSSEAFRAEAGRYQDADRLARIRYFKDRFFADPDSVGRNPRPGYGILVTLGFGWYPEDHSQLNAFLRELIEDLRGLGYPAHFLKTNTFDTIEANRKRIIPQLNELFAAEPDRKWIAVSLSRGSPDLWSSLSEMKRWDRLRGWIGLSSLNGASYFCELSRRLRLPRLDERTVRHSDVLKAIRMAQAICPSDMKKLVADAIDEVPTRLPWFEVVGVPERYNTPENPHPLMGGLYALARTLRASVGAHDGVIEYPGHIFPKEIEKRVVITTTGTHALADGKWEGLALAEPRVRRVLFRSLIETAIEAGGGFENTVSPRKN